MAMQQCLPEQEERGDQIDDQGEDGRRSDRCLAEGGSVSDDRKVRGSVPASAVKDTS